MRIPQWDIGKALGAIVGVLFGLLPGLLVVVAFIWRIGCPGPILWLATYVAAGAIVGWLIGGRSDRRETLVIGGGIAGAALAVLMIYLSLVGVECIPPFPLLAILVCVTAGAVTGGRLGSTVGERLGWVFPAMHISMKRVLALLVTIAATIPAIVVVQSGLRPCSWLDELLSRSGCLCKFEIEGDHVQRLILSPNGDMLATLTTGSTSVAQGEYAVKLWRVSDASLVSTLEYVDRADAIFTPDGMMIAVPLERELRLWQVSDGALQGTMLEHPSYPISLPTFSPEQDVLALASKNEIHLLRTSDGAVLHTLEGERDAQSLSFSPDGALLAAVWMNDTIRLWQVSDATLLHTIEGKKNHLYSAHSLAFSPDGTLLASVVGNASIGLWQVEDGTRLHAWEVLKPDERGIDTFGVEGLAFSPDGDLLASLGSDGVIRIWRVVDRELVQRVIVYRDALSVGGIQGSNLVFTSRGLTFAVAGNDGRSVWLWEVEIKDG